MKIAIIGAGAIGSVAAAYLTKAGQDVTLIGRDNQVEAIKAQGGLKVLGAGNGEIFSLKADTQLRENHDLVIFTVKTQDLESAYQANHEYLEDCYVLTSQNGVQADNILGVHFDREKVFSSIVMYGASYVKPGEVIYNFPGDWIIGKPFMAIDETTQTIADILKTAFPVVVSEDIKGMKWLKLFVNFNNCIPALTGKSMQETFADMDMCRLSIYLLKEGVEIVKAAGHGLVSLSNFPAERIYGLAAMPIDQAAGIMNQTLTSLSKEPLYGSILQSIMRGKDSEIDFINGEVVQLAHQMRMEAALNNKMVDLVHQVERTQKYFDFDFIKEQFQLNVQAG